jgi:hypothetical protein
MPATEYVATPSETKFIQTKTVGSNTNLNITLTVSIISQLQRTDTIIIMQVAVMGYCIRDVLREWRV